MDHSTEASKRWELGSNLGHAHSQAAVHFQRELFHQPLKRFSSVTISSLVVLNFSALILYSPTMVFSGITFLEVYFYFLLLQD